MDLFDDQGNPLRKKDESQPFYMDNNGNFLPVPSMFDASSEIFPFIRTCVSKKDEKISDEAIEEVWREAERKKEGIISALDVLAKENFAKGDFFRANAYKKAIKSLKMIQVPILSKKQVLKIPGIGKSIGDKIGELIEMEKLDKPKGPKDQKDRVFPIKRKDSTDMYVESLLRNVRKMYRVTKPQEVELRRQLEEMFEIKLTDPKAYQLNRMVEVLSPLTPLPPSVESTKRSAERIQTITEMLSKKRFRPRTVLDIGAGDAEIVKQVRDYYQLEKRDVYAIDQKLPLVSNVTVLTYADEKLKIPLPDQSIDLVILFNFLHHLPPTSRTAIIEEVSRVLSPEGYVIIREHDDYDHDPYFDVFLDLLHLFWYASKGEEEDPLLLMSRKETQSLFRRGGLLPVDYTTYGDANPQRLYHELYAFAE